MTCDPAVELVKEYCLAHREVDYHTTAITFSDLAATDLTRYSPHAKETHGLYIRMIVVCK